MSEKTVLVHKQNRIATLILNRPRVMNAMNPEMIQAMQEALDQIETDEDIRVVVVKGAGDNFCSGADFNLFTQEISAIQWKAGMRRIGKVITRLREIPQPVVSLLRGVAVGGGANLALAGDFVISADDARFSEVFIHIGLILDAGGTYFLPRLVYWQRPGSLPCWAKKLMAKQRHPSVWFINRYPKKNLTVKWTL